MEEITFDDILQIPNIPTSFCVVSILLPQGKMFPAGSRIRNTPNGVPGSNFTVVVNEIYTNKDVFSFIALNREPGFFSPQPPHDSASGSSGKR